MSFEHTIQFGGDGMIEVYEREYEVGKVKLELENVNGMIKIRGYDGETLKLRIEKSWGLLGSEPKVKIRKEGELFKIFTEHRKGFNISFGGSKVNFEIMAPKGVEVKRVVSVNGTIDITGVSGCMEAKTVNGPISLNVDCARNIKTVNGKINAKVGKLLGNISTINGKIEVYLGSIGEKVKITTVNGPITLHLHPKFNATVDVRTTNGNISTDFEEIKVMGTGKHYGPKAATGTLGDGRNVLRVSTTNGYIKILKG